MQDLSMLYSQFQKILDERDIWSLDLFKEQEFWNELSASEKTELAFLFVHRAEKIALAQECSDQDEVVFSESLALAEELRPDHALLLCKAAFALYHYGVLHQKGRCFLQALDKLLYAESLDKQIFEQDSGWHRLWGNVLTALARLVGDTAFLEQALDQFYLSEKTLLTHSTAQKQAFIELYWDWGEVWVRLGKHSGERVDFEKGLQKLEKASQLGCSLPHFLIDYGDAWDAYGMLKGDEECLQKALFYFREAIVDSYRPEKTISAAYLKAWVGYAIAAKHLFELTHKREHFEEADLAFQEALLACPEQSDLWLEWGELFLHSAWLKRDAKEIETALDKLTSSKIKECDPFRVSALLSQGVVVLGLFIEDLKLLRDGLDRVLKTLELDSRHPDLLYSAGLAHMAQALYFFESNVFAKAVACFEKGIELNSTLVQNWHGLFQTYLAWGMADQDPALVRKGIKAIERLSSLRPSSPVYLNEWGTALLRLRQIDVHEDSLQGLIEEAIDKFKKAWALNEDPETLYNWGCALDLLGDITGFEQDYEQAIELLVKASTLQPQASYIRYHLALSLSHLGELIGDADCLMQAVELFESLIEIHAEDSALFCDLGYALLILSEQIQDPVCPLRGQEMRCEAEKKLMRALELGNVHASYHLACLYSLSGYEEASIRYLQRADRDDALPAVEDLENDEWLAAVRQTEAFKAFISNLKSDY